MNIAIVNMAVHDCLGNDLESNFNRYINGDVPIRGISNFDLKQYDAIKITKAFELDDTLYEKIKGLDRYASVTFSVTKAALEGLEQIDNTAIIVNSLGGSQKTTLGIIEKLLDGERVAPRQALSGQRDNVSGLISRHFGFTGANFTITAACSSGIQSVQVASLLLESRQCDQVIIVGCDIMVEPVNIFGFQCVGALDRREDAKSCPFDLDRNGFVMGEGAACMVLRRMEDCTHALAVIKGAGASTELYHETSVDPAGSGARMCIAEAMREANVDIDFVNCHATSTPNGDASEYGVLSELFPNITVQALKANIGHTMAASGMVESVYGIMSLNKNIIPAVASLSNPLGDKLNFKGEQREFNAFLKTSFGFGGKCSAMVIEKYKGNIR